MPWTPSRKIGASSGGHVSRVAAAHHQGTAPAHSYLSTGDADGRAPAARPRGRRQGSKPKDRGVRVLSDLSALHAAPVGSFQKVRVQLEDAIEELEIDPWKGPVTYAPDGYREFVTHTIIYGNRCPTDPDHAKKPWFQQTSSEHEIALITAAKRNRRLREWKGADFIPREIWGAEPARFNAQDRPMVPDLPQAYDDGAGSEMLETTTEYDLVVFGATGYTGQLCVQQLDMLFSLPGATVHSWAVAGRSVEKLQAIAGQCATEPGVIRASTLDEISAMCRRCCVLISTAGPFVELGEPLVASCVAQGTHYIDVNGESVWMRSMMDKYHEQAKAKGLVLVFSAGQESAPYEIMAYKLVRRLGPIKRMRIYMYQFGNSSGGTVLTGIKGTEQMADPQYFKKSRDPFLLGGARNEGVRQEDFDMDYVEQDPLFPRLWNFPFAHSTAQVRVIRRSCALFEETPSDGVSYGERFLVCSVRDSAPKQKSAEVSLRTTAAVIQDPSQAAGASQGMQMSVYAGQSPSPGLGSTVEARGLYYSDCYAVAEAEDGARAHVHHTGPDTYEVTAICCVSGALCLLEELEAIRPHERGGCVTPAYAFHGTTYIERVEENSMAGTTHQRCVFALEDGLPSEDVLLTAVKERSKRALSGQAAFLKGQIKSWDVAPLSLPLSS